MTEANESRSPQVNVEREIKLEAGLHFSLPDLDNLAPGLRATALPNVRLQAVYMDTRDFRLLRQGITLRHRSETPVGGERKELWTLKLPQEADGVALSRAELTWPGPLGPVPVEAARLVRAVSRRAPLTAVAKLVTQRRRVVLDGPAGRLAEVDDDIVSVMDGRRLAARFREVEVELGDGSVDLVDALLDRLMAAGALPGDRRPKLVRAIGPRATDPPDIVVPEVAPDAPMSAVVAAAIASAVDRMVRHDAGVRLGDDPEHVHQARVGTRRLRSDLGTFSDVLDPVWVAQVRDGLGWIAAALGDVRDADVLTERLEARIVGLPASDRRAAGALLRKLAAQREAAHVRLFAVLDSDRYVAVLDQLVAAIATPPVRRRCELPGLAATPAPSAGPAGADPAPASSSGAAQPVAAPANGTVVVPRPAVAAARGVVTLTPPRTDNVFSGVKQATPGTAGGGGEDQPVNGDNDLSSAIDPVPSVTTAGPGAANLATGQGQGPDGSTPALRPASTPASTSLSASPSASPVSGSTSTPTIVPTTVGVAGAEAGDLGPDPEGPAALLAPSMVRKPWKKLRRDVMAVGETPEDDTLHQIRIRAKRVRYAAEATGVVVGRPARRLAAAAAALQGVLGDFHDACVAEEWLRQAAASGASTAQALVAGELIAEERQAQAACRREWKKQWRVLDDRRLREWLVS